MIVRAKDLGLLTGRPIIIIPKEIAKLLNITIGERVRLRKFKSKKEIIAVVDIGKILKEGNYVYISKDIAKLLHIKDGDIIEINPAQKPISIIYIREKLEGKTLTYEKLFSIMKSIVKNELTESEVAYFVSASYFHGFSFTETLNLIRAMVNVGDKIKFNAKNVLDKHCIGGVAGNRTTPIVTSIVAAAIKELRLNAVMPKTSSRAITSAAGTADVIEVLTKVEFSTQQIKKIVNKVKACMVWGGSLGISPADDKIIQVEKLINLDPESQLIASIMSKKLSVSSNRIIIDIPFGKDSKIENLEKAKRLKYLFEEIGKRFNLKLRAVITNGAEPIGNGIGPVLELRDIIKVLKHDRDMPVDLYNKSIFLSTELLGLIMNKNKAEKIIKKVVKEKKAFESFIEIIKAQGGKISGKHIKNHLKPSSIFKEIKAKKKGKIVEISNRKINFIARLLGCPTDKFAGVYLFKHVGDKVEVGEKYAALYSETEDKLNYAYRVFNNIKPILIK